jgi:D-aminopeptidase
MPAAQSAIVTRQEVNQEHLDPLYLAAVQAVEEAVVNALVAGEDAVSVKPEGVTVKAIDTGRLAALFAG